MEFGFGEMLVVLAIALLLFGPSKLPGLGKALGEAIRGFKDGMKDDPKAPPAGAPGAGAKDDAKALGPAARPPDGARAATPRGADRTARS